MIRATFLDHSGFLVELADVCLLFDWWKGALPPLPEKPLAVFVSHRHEDHFSPAVFSLADGTRMDSRLYQESVRAASPALAQAVYRGRVTAHRHSLEEYRINWEENTSTLHPNLPTAYDYTQEGELTYPGLDGLTRFVYRYSDETHPNVVYIGLAGDRVFVLNCKGAVNGDAALAILVQRLREEA